MVLTLAVFLQNPILLRNFTLAIQKGKLPNTNLTGGSKRELIGIEMELSFIEAEADEIAEDYGLTK